MIFRIGNKTSSQFAPVFFIAGIWLLARPYFGIRHDGILYSGQALFHFYPGVFSQDIFFAFGSQDDYSAYSRIVAFLLHWFNLSDVSLILLLLCLVAFVASALILFRPLLSDNQLWWSFLVLASFPHLYGANQIFAFAEPFLTARVMAEPLGLITLIAVWRRRFFWAGFWWLCAMAIHPLIALPVFLVGWLFLLQENRRWWWLVMGLPIVLILAFADVSPFSFLLQIFDAEWFSAVEVSNENVFFLRWSLMDWSGAAFDLSVLTIACHYQQGRGRKLVLAALWATIFGLLMAILGADVGHNVLLSGLQLWRVLWVAHFFALILLPFVFIRLTASDGYCRMVAWLLLCSGLTTAYPSSLAALSLAWILLGISAKTQVAPNRLLEKLVVAVVGAAIFLASVRSVRTMWLANAGVGELGTSKLWINNSLYLFAIPVVGIGIGYGYSYLARSERWSRALWVIALPLFILGACSWDRRTNAVRLIEEGKNGLELRRRIPENAQIYWQSSRGLVNTWLLLQRPSYYSVDQAAGLLFNRDTALEMKRRSELFIPFEFQQVVCRILSDLNQREEPCEPPPELIKEVCDKHINLDYMIFDVDINRWVDWSYILPGESKPVYFYNCSFVRSDNSIKY